MSTSAVLLRVQNLSFAYEPAQTPILTEISLEISAEELVLLCGPTGAGKSTLALCLNGLVPSATGGEVRGGISVADADVMRTPTPHLATDVGMVFQDPEGQLCTLFLEDEIAFGAENLCVPRSILAERVNEMLQLIELDHARQDSVFELSGGQKQKVNIVSVLAMQPRLLVLDMPTANLDPVGTAEVFAVIRRLVSEREIACIVIENRLDDLVPVADRVVVMGRHGEIAYDGAPAEVFLHGHEMVDGLGIEIPQVVEIALALGQRGLDVICGDDRTIGKTDGVPLTVEQLAERMVSLFEAGALHIRPDQPEETAVSQPEAAPVVRMQDVHFAYRRGQEVLKGISFEMQRGELLAIVGNNGSGKTTLVRLLIGLHRPASGTVEVCGLDARRAPVEALSAKVGYVFQYPEHQFVAQGQTVYDEIAFNLRVAGYSEPEVAVRVAELLAMFQLDGKEDKSPYELSGGQMRTLSVACMLSTYPELLILDEPNYGQDRHHIRALMARLADLRAQGTSHIMITHDMRLVAEYATSVLLLSDGQLLFHGRPAELFARPDLLAQAALKEPPACALVRALRERGIELPERIITAAELLAVLE